jgi:hypothetical protein
VKKRLISIREGTGKQGGKKAGWQRERDRDEVMGRMISSLKSRY